MSERMTRVRAGRFALADYGRLSRVDMIRLYREYYAKQLRDATEALAVSDDALVVETYRGAYSHRDLELVRY